MRVIKVTSKYAEEPPGRWQPKQSKRFSLSKKITELTELLRKNITKVVISAKLFTVFHRCHKITLSRYIRFNNGQKNALRRFLFPSQKTIDMGASLMQIEFAALCGEKLEFPGKKAIKLKILIAQLQELLNIYELTNKNKQFVKFKIYQLVNTDDIQEAKKQLNSWTLQLAHEEAELIRAGKKSKKTDGAFEDLVVETSKYVGFHIDRKRTTVAEFASHVKSFKRYTDSMNRQNMRNRKHPPPK